MTEYKRKELEKIKNNPIYFCEKYLGIKLSAWQKLILKNYWKK